MAYVANENIAIAQSDDPAGPFKRVLKDSLPASVKQLIPLFLLMMMERNIYTM
jgi:hypothetical protein